MTTPLPKNGPPLLEHLVATLIVQQAQTNRRLAILCDLLEAGNDERGQAQKELDQTTQWLQNLQGQ